MERLLDFFLHGIITTGLAVIAFDMSGQSRYIAATPWFVAIQAVLALIASPGWSGAIVLWRAFLALVPHFGVYVAA